MTGANRSPATSARTARYHPGKLGVTALAHAGTPVSERALSYVRRAIDGQIDAVVPYASLVGAHRVLTTVYGFSSEDASALLDRFIDAKRIHRYEEMPEGTVRSGFERAGAVDVNGWGGFYAQVAGEAGAETILTIDDDFDRFEDVSAEVILTTDEFATLNEYLGY